MILKGKIGIVLFLGIATSIVSQERQLTKANEAFDAYAFVKASKLYTEALEKGSNSLELYEKLGDSYYAISEFGLATHWYEQLLKLYPNDIKQDHINRYILSLKGIEAYQEAAKVQQQFLNDNVKKKMYDLTYLDVIQAFSGRFVLDTLNFNTKYSDYAPSFYKEQLIFTSSRNAGKVSNYIHEWNDEPFLDLYAIDITHETKKRQHSKRLKGAINTRFHESSTTFTRNGDTVYFTRNAISLKKSNKNTLLKICRASFDGSKWGKVEELPFNSEHYSVSNPALTPDGKFLYFTSDMPGGYGQSDLYVVKIDNSGDFGVPKNLGDKINTFGKETFPFISDQGRLFFASDGHDGLGGLDVFMATNTRNNELVVENLGSPINSPKDDFTFIINEEDHLGYFASNRKGGKGSDDIYAFKQIATLPDHFPAYKVKKGVEKHIHLQKNTTESITSF